MADVILKIVYYSASCIVINEIWNASSGLGQTQTGVRTIMMLRSGSVNPACSRVGGRVTDRTWLKVLTEVSPLGVPFPLYWRHVRGNAH